MKPGAALSTSPLARTKSKFVVGNLTFIHFETGVENPQGMETICKALGAEPLDWSYKTDCCGASAAVNDVDQSLLLMSRITKDAIARGANCFVTTCPMCQMNMDAYQDRVGKKYGIKERLPVYFITELLGIAIGISHKEMQIDRHFTDAVRLLKDLKLI